ncbi:2-oxo-4-hydroxy-4-carboxy-5-ureidoimidazoline decarboxylase [Luteipulveratus flavus]|uniref:2-oxo-4-hydroxy-4-carboxy-5-ureidoimidazoline decarboxylase n=1 Tax=Luteipulveratus flavus TaxID=3031728 RepID=A0ABT6C3I5_9MICO|nr:2-oxo-4-hydroxy-4-carboxy-5-ureidoimidazoline decarboxylase [Luteipulveratus sp. YIM 133296]MDF8262862.1 2-oxo-4-hydroxy-4-carboxy-5-ureidoimidazoline decarboxylase [Luteipulveratus sp. YIM 133296]
MADSLPLDVLNTARQDDVASALLSCCAATAWVEAVLAARPYADRGALLARSDEVFAKLATADVDAALAGHPRIGERATGQGRDARWSRQEQASVSDADADIQVRLREGNVAYERRFDRVFLIRAAGRSPQEMLDELTRRLGNDADTEAAEVREQLRQITRLRLEALLT